MRLSGQQVGDFNAALNEASVVAVEVDAPRRVVGVTFAVLALPADGGPGPEDRRVLVVLRGVGRVAASLRHGNWDDVEARVEEFGIERLADVVAGFGRQAVYGGEFLTCLRRWTSMVGRIG